MKIRELLTDESKWTKRFYAVDSNGEPLPPRSENAVSWCILGAINKCYTTEEFVDLYLKMALHLGVASLVSWNERATFQDVRTLVESLDI